MSYQTLRYIYQPNICSLKFYYQMSSIWIPYIIFRNTDNDDAVDIESTRAVVSIKKQGDFVRSGLDVANEVAYCIGVYS